MKPCSKCKVEKPETEFYARRDRHNKLRGECKVCCNAYGSKWKKENPESCAASRDKWRKAHPEEHAANSANWKKENPERSAATASAWGKANPEICAARTAKREAQKLQATPAWANQFFIEEIYDLAALRTKLTGIEWHVDHIVPLRSELVSGLHVEHNLRVIPKQINLAKGNRHWPDMPIKECSC